MAIIWEGLLQAIQLIIQVDPEVLRITWLSLKVNGIATLVAVLVGTPLGAALALTSFSGRSLAVSLVNLGMGLPPVVVGLWVSLFLWRSGPLGYLGLMYTPAAMVIAQGLIASPLVAGLSLAAFQQLDPRLRIQLQGLGASRLQMVAVLLWEARLGLLAAVIAGFGGVVSEVGAANMVGGNIMGQTRVLTTATVMEVGRGHFGLALALSFILMALAYGVTLALTLLQQRGRRL